MAFISTYQADYRKKTFIKSTLAKENLDEYKILPEGAVWLDTKINVKDVGLELSIQKIKEMYRKRMKSVYRTDYDGQTSFEADPADGESKEEVGDHMLVTCKKLKLSKEKDPVLPPLIGARKLFGYMNPKYFHTNLTEYEEEHGVNACNWMFGKDLKGNRGFLDKDRKKIQDRIEQEQEQEVFNNEDTNLGKKKKKNFKCCKCSSQ